MYVIVLPAYVSMHHVCVWYPQKLEEGIGSLGTGVVEGYGYHAGAGN